MSSVDFAFPVRAGEHACWRCDDPNDTEPMLSAFVHAGLARGHKVVHLYDRCERDNLVERLCADGAVGAALARGQFEVRDVAGAYATAGIFDGDTMVEALRDEHRRGWPRTTWGPTRGHVTSCAPESGTRFSPGQLGCKGSSR
jgi:hypothetical protein